MNSIIIPRIIIPKAREFLESGSLAPLKISLGDIRFDPVSGFLLKDVRLYTKDGSPAVCLISAKSVDIDLEWIPLLRRHVSIKRFDMAGADLRISRNSAGRWNFQPLTELGFMKTKDQKDFTFTIKEFRIINGTVDYSDSLKADNSLKRRFKNVNLSFAALRGESYGLEFSARAEGKEGGLVGAKLTYQGPIRSGEGEVFIVSAHLNDYWDYYLDDIFSPWNLKADEVALRAKFKFSGSGLSLNGAYAIKGGILNYGDICIKADASIEHRLNYSKTNPDKTDSAFQLFLKDASFLAGNNILMEKGECAVSIDKKEIGISRLEARALNQQVSYTGKFVFGEPKELSLNGRIRGIENTFDFIMSESNRGDAEAVIHTSGSNLALKAKITDLKDLLFDLNMEGDINISDLGPFFGAAKDDLSGKISILGNVSGEMDDAASLNGDAQAALNDISVFGIKPKSFTAKLSVKDGLLEGEIPEFSVYDGAVCGLVRFDSSRWGVEFNAKQCKLEKAAEEDSRLAGIKGELSANLACVGQWGHPEAAQGGGYLNLLDCNLKPAPIFIALEKGIGTVINNFSMPDFHEIKANFQIEDKKINLQSACKSPALNLDMSGHCDFSGESEIIAGADASGKGIIKAARQIMVPESIGLDFLKDGIQVKITGKWPDLKQETMLKPLRGLNEFFGFMRQMPLRKYSLEELWSEKQARHSGAFE